MSRCHHLWVGSNTVKTMFLVAAWRKSSSKTTSPSLCLHLKPLQHQSQLLAAKKLIKPRVLLQQRVISTPCSQVSTRCGSRSKDKDVKVAVGLTAEILVRVTAEVPREVETKEIGAMRDAAEKSVKKGAMVSGEMIEVVKDGVSETIKKKTSMKARVKELLQETTISSHKAVVTPPRKSASH